MKLATTICFLVVLVWGGGIGNSAFSPEKEKEFVGIGKMGERELTRKAQAVLEGKYPDENWEQHRFPKFVYINRAVLTGYKIAVKEPNLLAKFRCYCLCDAMGHKNLAHCFLKNGIPGNFDDHASECNICYSQAMRGFLWNELGAPDEEMQKAMKDIYDK